MRKVLMTAGIAVLCLAGGAGAQEPGSISAEQAVQVRRASMFMSGAIMSSMKAGIDAGASPRSQVFTAGTIARWAGAMPGVFPAGSGEVTGTKARPEIWTNRADFDAKAAALAAAATRLQELAQADDAAGFAAQWTEVRASCQSCHDVYKA